MFYGRSLSPNIAVRWKGPEHVLRRDFVPRYLRQEKLEATVRFGRVRMLFVRRRCFMITRSHSSQSLIFSCHLITYLRAFDNGKGEREKERKKMSPHTNRR